MGGVDRECVLLMVSWISNGELFEKAKPGCGRVTSLVVLSNLDLILFLCVVPMLRHPGCSSVGGVFMSSLIVAKRLYGQIATRYMCPGLISVLLGVSLLCFEWSLLFPLSGSGVMPVVLSIEFSGDISGVTSILCLLRVPFVCVVPMVKYRWLFMVMNFWFCGWLNL